MSYNPKRKQQPRQNYQYDAVIFNLRLSSKDEQFFYEIFIPSHFHAQFTRANIQGDPKLRVTIILYWIIVKSAFSCRRQDNQQWECRLPSADDLLAIVGNQLQSMFRNQLRNVSSLFIVTHQDMDNQFEKYERQERLLFYGQKQRHLINKNLYESLATKNKIFKQKYVQVHKIYKILIKVLSHNEALLPERQYQINFVMKKPRKILQTMIAYTKTMRVNRQPQIVQQTPSFQESIKIGTYIEESQESSYFYHSYQNKKTIFIQPNYPFISIIMVVNGKLTIKIDIEFNNNNISNIILLPKNALLFVLKRQPLFYAQYETNEMSITDISQFNKWHRILNFAVNYNEDLLSNRLKSHIFNKNTAIYLKCDRYDLSNINTIKSMCKDTAILIDRTDSRQSIKFLSCEEYTIKTGQNLTNYIRKYKQNIVDNYKNHSDRIKQFQEHFLISHFLQLDYSIAIENGVHKKIDEIVEQLQQKYSMKDDPTHSTMTEIMKEMYQKLHVQKAYLGFKQQPQVPRKQELKILKIYNLALTPTGTVYKGYTNEFSCRVLRQFPSQLFIKVTFCDDNLKSILAQTKTSDNKYIIQSVFRNEINGFTLAGVKYVPLGWSNSQIKRAQLWFIIDHQLFQVNRNDVTFSLRDDIYNFLGNFEDVDVRKRPSRIGQSFSNSQCLSFSKLIEQPIQLSEIKTQTITDQYNKNIKRQYIFSDGIGQISTGLLEKIKEELRLNKDVCSLQIRFLGYKGVLTLGNFSDVQNYQVRMPKSMKKYQCEDSRALAHFDVLNWNKYSPGYINCQIILLLLARKISIKVILKKMQQFLNREVYGLEFTEDTLINHFKTHLETSPINQDSLFDLLNCILETKDTSLSQLIHNQVFFCELLAKVKRQLSLKVKNKLRFRVQKATRLMGILDFYNVLKQGEVYCTIRKHEKRQLLNINQRAFITKNPCLHPKDIRIVNCISDKEIRSRLQQKGIKNDRFKELVNVIVFPQQGIYPLSATISGGDLDGDYYILCWDQELIPRKHAKEHLYDDGIIKEAQASNTKKYQIKIVQQHQQENIAPKIQTKLNIEMEIKQEETLLIKDNQLSELRTQPEVSENQKITQSLQSNMEKPLQSNMEKPLQSNMEKPLQSNMEKPLQSNMEKPLQSNMEKPLQSNMEKPLQSNMEKPLQSNMEKPLQSNMEKPLQSNMEKPLQSNMEKPLQSNMEKPLQSNMEKPLQSNMEKPLQSNMEKPLQSNMEKPLQSNMEKPLQSNMEKPLQSNMEKPLQSNMEKEKNTQPLQSNPPQSFQKIIKPSEPAKNLYHLYRLGQMFQFFINYLQTSKIGLISYYHLLWAQNGENGAWSRQCTLLAKAHSYELDYSKKGVRPNLEIPVPPREFKKYSHKNRFQRTSDLSRLYGLALEKFQQNGRRLGLQARYSNSISWVFRVDAFNYTNDEIDQAMRIIQSYKNDIQDSLRSKGMFNSSQFVIYHGRDEDLITDSIVIKQKYKSIFFKHNQSQLQLYQKHKIETFFEQKVPIFSVQAFRKAFLWHIVSNSVYLVKKSYQNWKYQEIVDKAADKIQKMKEGYLKLLKSGWFGIFFALDNSDDEDESESYIQKQNAKSKINKSKNFENFEGFENVYGLCWNVIPKTMISLIKSLHSLKQA